MPSPCVLDLKNIVLKHGVKTVLENISFELSKGEILTIIGPNGAGKTSLIRIALGLLEPSSGEVFCQPKIQIGYMPQRLQIDPTLPLTVKRFLSMGGNQVLERVVQVLKEVGAYHVLEAPLRALSGGEFQRVLLARALIRNPRLLVLDEPVQGVDVHGQVELYHLITQIRDQRECAVLMVSHDLHLVMAATDRVLCLNRHICCSGSPEMVTSDPAYLELFGSHAVQHLAIYSHNKTHRHDTCIEDQEGQHVR